MINAIIQCLDLLTIRGLAQPTIQTLAEAYLVILEVIVEALLEV